MPKAYHAHVSKMILQHSGHIALFGINGSLNAPINQILLLLWYS